MLPAENRPALSPEVMRALQSRYRGNIASTLDLLRGIARQLAAAPDAPDAIDLLRRELHRVHGSAGSYGYEEASRLAGQLEQQAAAWDSRSGTDRVERATIVTDFIRRLEAAFANNGPADLPPAR